MGKRPSWDHYWFTLCLMYSTRGTCDRFLTSTVIVKGKRMVGAGYNGSPPGVRHCDEIGHLMIDGHCERAVHGEANAIINTERSLLIGATAYMLGSPCLRCANGLISAGIKSFKCLGKYTNSLGKEHLENLCKEAGVELEYYDIEPSVLIEEAVARLKSKGGVMYQEE